MSDPLEENCGTTFGKARQAEEEVAEAAQPREMDLEELIGALSPQVGISCVTDHCDSSIELSQASTVKSDDPRKLKRSNPSPDSIGRSKLATRSPKLSSATLRKKGVRKVEKSERHETDDLQKTESRELTLQSPSIATEEDAPATLVSSQGIANLTSFNIHAPDSEISLLATNRILREQNTVISTRLRETAQQYAEAWSEREAEYEAKIGSLERRLYEQQEAVESAKAAASLIMEQNRSFTLSDAEVSMWFATRARSWYEWAKEAAHRDCDLVHEKYEEIHAHVQKFVIEQDGDIPGALWKTKPKRLPYLLLHGMVANFICTKIFKNPFWILEALPQGDESGGLPTCMQQALAELNEVLLQLNTKNAHQWRAQLLRIFATAGENPTLATCKARYADALTGKFLNSAARFCLKQEAEFRAYERMDFLKDEISRALEFSLQLWAQRSRLDAVDLEMFHRHELGKYVQYSELMEPHQSQRSDAPEDYQGSRILMVVQPAIVAFGTEDGRDYDEISRVWLKARVLMEEPEGEVLDAMVEN